jgi:isopenicillin N synthase-like dioxygenase
MDALPVVDLAGPDAGPRSDAFVGAAVEHALTQRGFLYLRGHGIDPQLMTEAFASAAAFFAQPQAVKDGFAYRDAEANFGYQGIAVERLDPHGAPDLKEAFTMRNVAVMGASGRWPSPAFRTIAEALYQAGIAAAGRLLAVMGRNLGLPASYFAVRHGGENVTLRYLHYPANAARAQPDQLGAGAHTDYGSVTLLLQDDVGGLEVQDAAGQWLAAPKIAGALVVNTGDLMEHWTNGRYRSTLHRVRPIEGAKDRYSIALFVDPDSAVDVDCLPGCVSPDRPARYPRTTAGEHLHRKIVATHGNPP